MDKANFEIVGNVGKFEIKTFGKGKTGGKLATLSVATSERWKTEDGTQKDRTYWHRITVFSPTIIARIESMVQKGTRVRLIGRIRPGSYDDDKGRTRYVIEFVLRPFGVPGFGFAFPTVTSRTGRLLVCPVFLCLVQGMMGQFRLGQVGCSV
jgi:single-strand DNA-binding protein